MNKKADENAVLLDAIVARLPNYPTPDLVPRESSVPAALRDEPIFKQLAREREAIRARELEVDTANNATRVANERATAQWEKALRESTYLGAPVPPKPADVPVPYPDASRQQWDRLYHVINADEQAALARGAERWLSRINAEAAVADSIVISARAALAEAERNAAPLAHARDLIERAVAERGIERNADGSERRKRAVAPVAGDDSPQATFRSNQPNSVTNVNRATSQSYRGARPAAGYVHPR